MKSQLRALVLCAAAISAPFTMAEGDVGDMGQTNEKTSVSTSDEVRLEEVIVTVQKREQTAFSVPISFSVFDSEKMDDLGLQNIDKVGQWTPGVTLYKQSVIFPNLSIRGVTANNSSAFQQPRVSVYQNGVDISRTNGASIAYFDLAHIDVLKGPQGSLFGRASAIGALNIRQQVAENENSASFKLTAGNNNKRSAEVILNGVLQDDRLFGRLALFTDSDDGHVDNLAGGHLSGTETEAARGSLVFSPTEETEMIFMANYQKDTPSNTGYINMYFANPDDFYEVDAEAGTNNSIERELWDVNLNVHSYLTDFWSLYTVTSYREFDMKERFDADGMGLKILDLSTDYAHKQANQEVRFNFEGDEIAGFIGSNVFWEEGHQEQGMNFDESPFLQLPAVQGTFNNLTGNPIYQPFSLESLRTPPPVYTPWTAYATNPDAQENQQKHIKNLFWDIFADATFTLTENFNLTLGLRATYEDLQSTIITPAAASPTATAGILGTTNVIFTTQGKEQDQLENSFWDYTGRLVGSYSFSPQLNGYASYSRGLRSHVLEFSNASMPATLEPEIVDSYELGMKWLSANARHNFNAAIFYFDYQNFRTAVVSTGNPLVIETNDEGQSSSSGMEMDWISLLSEHWRLFGNAAYLDARIDDDAAFAYAGNRFRMAPEWSGALGLDYHRHIFTTLQLMLGLNASYQSKVFFEDDNDSFFGQNSQDGYSLLNFHSMLAGQHNAWEVRLFIDNILDKEYFLDAGNTGNTFGMSTYVPGATRSYRVSYKMSF